MSGKSNNAESITKITGMANEYDLIMSRTDLEDYTDARKILGQIVAEISKVTFTDSEKSTLANQGFFGSLNMYREAFQNTHPELINFLEEVKRCENIGVSLDSEGNTVIHSAAANTVLPMPSTKGALPSAPSSTQTKPDGLESYNNYADQIKIITELSDIDGKIKKCQEAIIECQTEIEICDKEIQEHKDDSDQEPRNKALTKITQQKEKQIELNAELKKLEEQKSKPTETKEKLSAAKLEVVAARQALIEFVIKENSKNKSYVNDSFVLTALTGLFAQERRATAAEDSEQLKLTQDITRLRNTLDGQLKDNRLGNDDLNSYFEKSLGLQRLAPTLAPRREASTAAAPPPSRQASEAGAGAPPPSHRISAAQSNPITANQPSVSTPYAPTLPTPSRQASEAGAGAPPPSRRISAAQSNPITANQPSVSTPYEPKLPEVKRESAFGKARSLFGHQTNTQKYHKYLFDVSKKNGGDLESYKTILENLRSNLLNKDGVTQEKFNQILQCMIYELSCFSTTHIKQSTGILQNIQSFQNAHTSKYLTFKKQNPQACQYVTEQIDQNKYQTLLAKDTAQSKEPANQQKLLNAIIQEISEKKQIPNHPTFHKLIEKALSLDTAGSTYSKATAETTAKTPLYSPPEGKSLSRLNLQDQLLKIVEKMGSQELKIQLSAVDIRTRLDKQINTAPTPTGKPPQKGNPSVGSQSAAAAAQQRQQLNLGGNPPGGSSVG